MSNMWQPIKSRLQNTKILTASIAQEIEEDGKRRTPMKKQRERRKGEEGRSLTSTPNEAMMRPVCLVLKMIMNAWCMSYVVAWARLCRKALN